MNVKCATFGGEKLLGAILAGGRASRMGRDKASLLFGGGLLVERVCGSVGQVADELVIVGGETAVDDIETIPDYYPEANSMGGIGTALRYGKELLGPDGWTLVAACDMPFINPELLRALWERRENADVVLPVTEAGFEPMCALYNVRCLPVVDRLIGEKELRLRRIFDAMRTVRVGEEELRRADPELDSFININRPDELELALTMLGDKSSV